MLNLNSQELISHLESTYHYKVLGTIDIDWLVRQPRKTLYQLFIEWHKPVYQNNEKIILFSRNSIDPAALTHIQKCASQIDISNFFILICCPSLDPALLEQVRKDHSHDDCTLEHLAVSITDPMPEGNVNHLISLPESFCFAPWAHLEISSQGEFKPCCAYKESIKDNNGRPYNIESDSIETVYNSKYLFDLRQQFSQGQRPEHCSHCWFKEQNNGQSNRQWVRHYLGSNADTITIEEESVDNLISLDIKMGNLCNFKCRICNPFSSSRIAEEQVAHFNTLLDIKSLNRKGRWAEDSRIWQMIGYLGAQLVNIDFYGGEPFLIKQHEIFLDYLIEKQHSHKIRLHYNTNGSVFPKQLFDKWKKFHHVDIAFSIDNVGQRFELERGGSWSKVTENIDQFFDFKLPNMTLNVFATINSQNVYYLADLINWYETKAFNKLHLNLLESPPMLSVVRMNEELCNLVIDKLDQIPEETRIKYGVNSIVDLIKQNKNSPEMVDQLKTYMLQLDNIRNQDFAQTHSEIASVIYKGNKHG